MDPFTHPRTHEQFAWQGPAALDPATAERARAIAARLDAPHALGRVLAARGLDEDGAGALRATGLRAATRALAMPPGVRESAARIEAHGRHRPIGLLADYDVDGATSQAILVEALRAAFPQAPAPVVAVPDRDGEGFGVNRRCLAELAGQGAGCIVTLDCGTASGALLDAFAAESGIEIVVIDHHRPYGDMPPKRATVLNPWVSTPEPGDLGALCTAGLAWFVAHVLLRNARPEALEDRALRQRMTVLAALGTVCDVMPLTTFNRTLVRTGVQFAQLAHARTAGLDALLRLARVELPLRSSHFGWQIGPRVNAGSRMGESALAAQCLRATTGEQARPLAARLDAHNAARVEKCRAVDRAIERAEPLAALAAGPVNLIVSDAASPGTAGLAASTLVKRFGWPAAVLCPDGNGALAGSARSALRFNFGDAVSQAVRERLLERGGGHAQACGLNARPENIEALRTFLRAAFAHTCRGAIPTHRIETGLEDASLDPDTLLHLATSLRSLEPWGNGFRAPMFGAPACTVTSVRERREHVFLTLASGGHPFPAIWWRAPENWRSRLGLEPVPTPCHIIGHVDLDQWRGRHTARVTITDARPALHGR